MGMPPRTPGPPPPYSPGPQSPDPWQNRRAPMGDTTRAQRRQWKAQQRMPRVNRSYYLHASRHSLVGPLLLVGIGVIALLMTLHRLNAAGFWRWYGHWWPLVFIGAGLVLTLESMAFSSSNRHIRLGGGVVFFGLILAGIGILAAHNHVNWTAISDQLQIGDTVDLAQMFGKKHQATEEIDHPLPANGTLVIQNRRGDVIISTGPDNQMHLKLDKTVYGNSDSAAERRLRAMEPLILSSGKVVTVHMPSSDSQVANMTFSVPADAIVQVHSEHGDVTINGQQAAVTVIASDGDVQLGGITGPVHATIHHGDFSASSIQGDLTLAGGMNDVTLSQIGGVTALDGDFFGDVHLEKLHGPMHFHSSRTDLQIASLEGSVSLDNGDLTMDGASGPVSLATHAMNVQLRHVSGAVRVHNENGEVELTMQDPIGAVEITNRNGSVHVGVPRDASFSVEAAAVDGEIHDDFSLPATENGAEHSVVSGSVGGGGPLVHITAAKGDITLHKS